jgi:diguanylate cyclase (GGDEF)-like protein
MKLVIVDDSEVNLQLLKGYLSAIEDLAILLFSDPRQALTGCLHESPDLILLDYLMPDLDGLDFLRQLRQVPALDEVPVVMITSHEDRQVCHQALWEGASDFLYTPVDRLELEARVRNLLRQRMRTLALNRINAHWRVLATLDDLTGVYNRRTFLERLATEIARAQRYQRPLSLIMLDADHFKQVNDRYGHAAGDQVLKALIGVCLGDIRQVDFIGRLGGEEFAVGLPETALPGAESAAERLRWAVETALVTVDGGTVRFTISLGVAQLLDTGEDSEALLKRADQALYQAKSDGRNRVAVWRPPVPAPVTGTGLP